MPNTTETQAGGLSQNGYGRPLCISEGSVKELSSLFVAIKNACCPHACFTRRSIRTVRQFTKVLLLLGVAARCPAGRALLAVLILQHWLRITSRIGCVSASEMGSLSSPVQLPPQMVQHHHLVLVRDLVVSTHQECWRICELQSFHSDTSVLSCRVIGEVCFAI